jgi:nucleoredoxin
VSLAVVLGVGPTLNPSLSHSCLLQTALADKLSVGGLPTLVFVDPAGGIISSAGRKIVIEDPQAEGFPWAPKPFTEIFGTTFVDNKGQAYGLDHLKGKYIGLFFSAMWCPLCRMFTPQLIGLYNRLKAENKPMEIIYISSDREESSFEENFAIMPWLTLDGDVNKRKFEISEYFKVKGIPTLVILDPSFKTITLDGRRVVGADLKGTQFPWLPKPLNPFNASAMSVVNEYPFLLAITDGSKAAVANATTALTQVSTAEFSKLEPKLRFFFVQNPDEDILQQTKSAASLEDNHKLLILDIQSGKKYIAPIQELTSENVSEFVETYFKGKLEAEDI